MRLLNASLVIPMAACHQACLKCVEFQLRTIRAFIGCVGRARADSGGFKGVPRSAGRAAASRRASHMLLSFFMAAGVLAETTYRPVEWPDLLAPNWSPDRTGTPQKLDDLADSDPKTKVLFERLKRELELAPSNPAVHGTRIRLSGFVIPLKTEGDAIREFLLVPFFGSCIHTPPPAASQMVIVKSNSLLRGLRLMTRVAAHGVIFRKRTRTDWGTAGYEMQAEIVVPYR